MKVSIEQTINYNKNADDFISLGMKQNIELRKLQLQDDEDKLKRYLETR
jgi:hypothetical protein